MSDLLATFEADSGTDAEILDAVAQARPHRVTVLVPGDELALARGDGLEAEELRDRLARLLAAIERRTGAIVVGLAGDRAQLAGRRFDREVGARVPVAA